MIHVPIDKIVPLTSARDSLSKIISDVEAGTPMYVLTKNGKPVVAVASIDFLHQQVGNIDMPATTSPAQIQTSTPPEPQVPGHTFNPMEASTQTASSTPIQPPTPPLSETIAPLQQPAEASTDHVPLTEAAALQTQTEPTPSPATVEVSTPAQDSTTQTAAIESNPANPHPTRLIDPNLPGPAQYAGEQSQNQPAAADDMLID